MNIELNLDGITKMYTLPLADALPPPAASNPQTLYLLRQSGEIFATRLQTGWVKVNNGIKIVDALPDARQAVQLLFYGLRDERNLYTTYDGRAWTRLHVEITEQFTELPAPDTVPHRVEYLLLPSRIKYTTYDNVLWSVINRGTIDAGELPPVAEAKPYFIYLVRNDPQGNNEYITYDNIERKNISSKDSVLVVDTLPDAAQALPDIIYADRTTGKEWITYDNVKRTCLRCITQGN